MADTEEMPADNNQQDQEDGEANDAYATWQPTIR
jgi:hypothetical protein